MVTDREIIRGTTRHQGSPGLANALPDIDSDRAVSAGGFASAAGAPAATIAALLFLVSAVALLVWHLPLPPMVAAAIAVGASLAAGAVALWGRGRALFRFVMVLAVAAVAMLIAPAGTITA